MLYAVSAVLGLIAVLIAGPGTGIRIVCIVVAFAISLTVWLFVFSRAHLHPEHLHAEHREGLEAAPSVPNPADQATASPVQTEHEERVG